jgi:creatinine amidohydrolase
MRVAEMNWMQIEAQARRDDRAVLPLGSIEQHAHLSLAVDAILSERVAVEAAEPLGVPVFPALAYGLTPNFVAFPGTLSLRPQTYLAVVADLLEGVARAGFARIVIVNGHGGNSPAQAAVFDWLDRHPGVKVKWHNWWNAPKTWAKVQAIDPVASHASWMENFPWTRVSAPDQPAHQKPMVDLNLFQQLDPDGKRRLLGDGNYGGLYQRSDEDMLALWRVAVEETRATIEQGWA